jgi:hypothetical protein
MAIWTVGPLTPVDMPYEDLGVGTAKSMFMLQSNVALDSEFNVGDFVISATGTLTIQASELNINPMLVRIYHRPGNSWHDLGMLDPGESATYSIDYDVVAEDSEINDPDKPMFDVYVRHDPTGGNVGFTVTNFEISYQVTDVQPLDLLLVTAGSPSFSSSDASTLSVSNLLSEVLVNGQPVMEWVEAAGNRTVRVELVGDLQSSLNTTSNSYGIDVIDLDDNAAPGTYVQPYRARLYLVVTGESEEETLEEITVLDPESDATGTVTFVLTGEGGGEQDPDAPTPWWYCIPKEAIPVPPARSTSFVVFADYDADYKFPLASSRVPAPIKTGPFEEGCHGCAPEIISCEG